MFLRIIIISLVFNFVRCYNIEDTYDFYCGLGDFCICKQHDLSGVIDAVCEEIYKAPSFNSIVTGSARTITVIRPKHHEVCAATAKK